MGYYDIDDVLTDSAEIPCTFNHTIPGLGFLQGNPGKSINKNTRVTLPLWMSRMLAMVGGEEDGEDIPFVELNTPTVFSQKVINAIRASPTSLDIHSLYGHYYDMAIKWIGLFEDEKFAEICSELLLQRSIEINAHANSVMLNIHSNHRPSNLKYSGSNKGPTTIQQVTPFLFDIRRI
ncbi:hypothetical protein TBLA_0I00150 [Henningerozyma blattae CBS 6284]|uniref:DNA replication complex GINS protein PSF3 n=1 Tax=Henningerozyma blattae (strain ATCC 34711 / CBS 6284 / DSM 70876 / NBRC 10599 / NRRL Y-10934 / UCD 77-7) TaxID=1071380 RepID=I2H8H8_HENB6|nr:hypothetical protein TBLA_0I00150 [Tetrapisispora blattae CBS 6284]CCH62680.1 hypothetical protein TBLA_0I00150 [Tetrapisispora blattae CBS 6284]